MNESLVSPGERRTKNHRNKMAKWWNSKAWREFVKEKTEGKVCEMCGVAAGDIRGNRKPAKLTVDHPNRESYISLELYLDYEASRCRVVCTTCNWMFEKGKIICPVCKARYMPFTSDMCGYCFLKEHPEIKEKAEQAKREKRKRQRELRKKQADKVKAWKKAHPVKKVQP